MDGSWSNDLGLNLPAAAAKSLQSCLTLCDPIDGSPPGSPIPGILQARTLEWIAISFSNAWKWKVKLLSRVWLSATPWTAAFQAPPSMGFSRQECWSGVPLPSLWIYLFVAKLQHNSFLTFLNKALPFSITPFSTTPFWPSWTKLSFKGFSLPIIQNLSRYRTGSPHWNTGQETFRI